MNSNNREEAVLFCYKDRRGRRLYSSSYLLAVKRAYRYKSELYLSKMNVDGEEILESIPSLLDTKKDN